MNHDEGKALRRDWTILVHDTHPNLLEQSLQSWSIGRMDGGQEQRVRLVEPERQFVHLLLDFGQLRRILLQSVTKIDALSRISS